MIKIAVIAETRWEGSGEDFRVIGYEPPDEAAARLAAQLGEDVQVEWTETPAKGPARGWATFAVGTTLADREMNGYDDSDFYAVWWDGRRLRQTLYNTTRCAGGGLARVDGPSEADREKIERWLERWLAHRLLRRAVAAYRYDKSNRVVTVTRGRKAPIGSTWKTGKVFDGGYGKCVHLYPLAGGEPAVRYVSIHHVEIAEPPISLELLREMIRDARREASVTGGHISVHLPFCADAYRLFA